MLIVWKIVFDCMIYLSYFWKNNIICTFTIYPKFIQKRTRNNSFWFTLVAILISRLLTATPMCPILKKVQSRSAMSNRNGILSQNVCNYLDQGRTLNDIILRAAHWMVYFDFSKLNLAYTNILSVRIITAMATDVINGTEDHPLQKCQIHNYQNKDRLSVCRILLLQRKPKLGRTKPSTGPRVGHGWSRYLLDMLGIYIW